MKSIQFFIRARAALAKILPLIVGSALCTLYVCDVHIPTLPVDNITLSVWAVVAIILAGIIVCIKRIAARQRALFKIEKLAGAVEELKGAGWEARSLQDWRAWQDTVNEMNRTLIDLRRRCTEASPEDICEEVDAALTIHHEYVQRGWERADVPPETTAKAS
jgi:hypothetical protein